MKNNLRWNRTDTEAIWCLVALLLIGGSVATHLGCNGCSPTPKPPVVVPDPPGAREVFLIHESADDGPALAQLILDLRTGESQKYLLDRGHNLQILDDDSEDENKQPSKVIESLKPSLAGHKLPVLIIREPKSQKVLVAQEVPDTTTAAEIIATLKSHGG